MSFSPPSNSVFNTFPKLLSSHRQSVLSAKNNFNANLNEKIELKELKEVDFVNELWNILNPRKNLIKYFYLDAKRNFQLVNDFKLDDSLMKFGNNYVSDLLLNCSECRNKLLDIDKFVNERNENINRFLNRNNLIMINNQNFNSKTNFSPSIFYKILSRPIISVLKRFLEDMESNIQYNMIHHRDVTSFSSCLLSFKPRVEKVYNFFKPIFMTMETTLDIFDLIWNKFLIGLNTCSDLDDELPIWQKLYKELTSITLGEYFNEICRQRLVLNPVDFPSASLTRWSSTMSLTNNNSAVFLSTTGASLDNYEDVTSGHNVTLNYSQKNSSGILGNDANFALLWTSKVRNNLAQAHRFVEKLTTSNCESIKSEIILQEKSFQEIYQQTFNQLQKISKSEERENPFKFLVNLIEQSTLLYKKQYTDCIFQSVLANNKLETTLKQISELYTFRAFANHISGFYDEMYLKCSEEVKHNSFNFLEELNKALNILLKKVQINVNNNSKNLINAIKSNFNVCNDWKIEMLSMPNLPWKFFIKSNLEWPLNCVLSPELFNVLNKCLEQCQILFHAHKCALILSLKKFTLDLTWESLEARRKRLLARGLLECITILYSIIRQYLESFIEQKSAQILRALTLEEMDQCILEWITEFENFFDTESNNTYINPAIQALCTLIHKFYTFECKTFIKSLNTSSVNKSFYSPDGSTHMIIHKKRVIKKQIENDEDIQWRSPRSVPDLMLESRSTSNSDVNDQQLSTNKNASFLNDNVFNTIDNNKSIRCVEKWLKTLRNIKTYLMAAAQNPTSSLDTTNVEYIIAILCLKNF